MCVHLRVAITSDFQIEESMLGEEREHVIQESDTRIDLALASAIEVQFQVDLGFRCFSVDCCAASHLLVLFCQR